MKKQSKIQNAISKATGAIIEQGDDGLSCQIPMKRDRITYSMYVIVSWGGGWEHVSLHCGKDGQPFTPSWSDMCYIKNLFFKPSETVVQFHPASDSYVNCHENVLHLWRPTMEEIKLPPIKMV